MRHGCVRRKSFIGLKLPNLHISLLQHFLRGFVDGDGSLVVNKKGQWRVDFVGCLSMMQQIQSLLIRELGLSKVKILKRPGVYRLQYTGTQQAARIVEFLKYYTKQISLPRKKKRALLCLAAAVVSGRASKRLQNHEPSKFEVL